MTDINEIDELFSRKIPFKIRFKNMAWHYLLTFLSWLGFWGEKYEKYSIPIHIENLKKILKEQILIHHCPAGAKYYDRKTYIGFKLPGSSEFWQNGKVCKVCRKFVSAGNYWCPCLYMGVEEARRRSIEAIEKYEKFHKEK